MAQQGEIVLNARRTAQVRIPCGELDSLEPANVIQTVPTAQQAVVGAPVAAYSISDQNWGLYLVWFIVATLIIWIILYLLRPAFLQTRNPDGSYTGNVDNGKAFGAAVVLALIIVLIIWLVRRA